MNKALLPISAILILASFGLLASGSIADVQAQATLTVTDQFGQTHQVDASQFIIVGPDACLFDHFHAANGEFVISIDGARLDDPNPFVCGYGIVGLPLEGTLVPVCGNGAIEEGETCDDANTTDGDGCDSSCNVEPGFTCQGEPSVCTAVNNAPELDPIPDQSVDEGGTLNVLPRAIDPDGDGITLSINGILPTFAVFTDNGDGTGKIVFLPEPGDAGTYFITVKATDDGSPPMSDFETFELKVNAFTPVTVPDVVGKTQADAQSAIVQAGLRVGDVTNENHPTVPVGEVIRQDPTAGDSVAPGTAVDLTVSSGPPGVEGTRNLNIPACTADVNNPSDVQALLVPGTGGITSFSFQFVPDPTPNDPDTFPMLLFDETWTGTDTSYIIICGLAANTSYQVKKTINHNVPDDPETPDTTENIWKSFDNELLDPCCDALDADQDQLAETFVPMGYSQSNNFDGLSFSMGEIGNPPSVSRSSTIWADSLADEFVQIDFLNFPGPAGAGLMTQGDVDNFMTYGLIEISGGLEQPFILTQTPNPSKCDRFVQTTEIPTGDKFEVEADLIDVGIGKIQTVFERVTEEGLFRICLNDDTPEPPLGKKVVGRVFILETDQKQFELSIQFLTEGLTDSQIEGATIERFNEETKIWEIIPTKLVDPDSGIPELTGTVTLASPFGVFVPIDDGVVGGEIIPIEPTSLILAGAQSFSWVIPVLLSIIGIGIFLVSRKS